MTTPPAVSVRSPRAAWRGAALAAAALASSLLLAAGAAAQGPPTWVADELLVGLRAVASGRAADAAFRAAGAQKIGEIEPLRLQRLRVPPAARDAVAAALARRPEVEFVEKNRRFAPDAVPDDPDYSLQWHLETLGLPGAWEVSTGSDEVVVAILDSGVDPSHPDLASRLLPGMDTASGGSDTSPLTGHGTRVAGAAAAAANNAVGVASPNWHAQILPFRVTDSSGWTTAWALSAALTEAADQGARVANMSFGGVAGDSTVRAAAQYMTERGGVVVAGSGNCGCRESISDTPYILSVGGTTQNDDLAGFSSTGDYVDFTAPGVSIRTTDSGGGYTSVSGSSYSGPVLAGVVALLLAIDPQLTASDVEALLADTAVDLGAPGWDESFGHGRIDAYAAVVELAGGEPPPPPPPPPCPDADGDLACDDVDNCSFVPNADQSDSNADGFGDACDPDLDGDGIVGIRDFGILAGSYGLGVGDPGFDPACDFDGDDVVGIGDVGVLSAGYGGTPGPSGLGCAGAVPCEAPQP